MEPALPITIRPLTHTDRAAAGLVYARAFERLMHSMLRGRADRAAGLMADVLQPSPNLWVADLDGTVAGLAWVQDVALPGAGDHTWKVIRRRLGRRDACRAVIFSAMLHGVSVKSDRLYLDSLAVDPRFEGRGVGGALLRHVVDEARRRHKAAVCLYVIARDRRPRAIYEHFGFVTLHSEAPRVFESVIGFGRTDYMELAFDGDPAPAAAELESSRRVTRVRARLKGLFDRSVWRRVPTPPAHEPVPDTGD